MPFYLDAVLQTPPGFSLIRVAQYWPLRNSSLLWVFPPCTVHYWVFFHPVHSLQPQWGHFNIIHFFRNTSQTNWASGEDTQSHLWFATLGNFCPFMSFWIIYTRPALTKMSFTVPMICTLLSQNDCIWTLICTLWLVKTKLASFCNINSNVDTKYKKICLFELFLPFLTENRLNWESWEVKLLCFFFFLFKMYSEFPKALQYF